MTDKLKTGWSEFKAIDYIETEEDLEAYVKARIEDSRDTRHILCRWGFHLWRWLPENKERCTRCGCIREDLP